jgi:hypothetical protein
VGAVDPFDVPVDPFDVPAALVPLFALPPQAPVNSRAPTMTVPPSSLTVFIELISISLLAIQWVTCDQWVISAHIR